MKVHNGTSFVGVPYYWNGSLWVPLIRIISCSDTTVNNTRQDADCHARYKIDNDQFIYKSDEAGNYGASFEEYVLVGSATDYYVERTINSGSLDVDDIGGSRVNLGTDREIAVIDTTIDGNPKTANVTLDFYDAATGGNLLDTADITLTALKESGA